MSLALILVLAVVSAEAVRVSGYYSPSYPQVGYYQVPPAAYYGQVPAPGYYGIEEYNGHGGAEELVAGSGRQEVGRQDKRYGSAAEGGFAHGAKDDYRHEDLQQAERSGAHAAGGADGRKELVAVSRGGEDYQEAGSARQDRGRQDESSEGAKRYDSSAEGVFGHGGKAGYKQAHKDSGFSRTYKNHESGQDSSYLDEEHSGGQEAYGQAYDGAQAEAGADSYGQSRATSGYGQAGSGEASGRAALDVRGGHSVAGGDSRTVGVNRQRGLDHTSTRGRNAGWDSKSASERAAGSTQRHHHHPGVVFHK